MNDVINYFTFSEFEIVLLSILFILCLIQLLYYLVYYNKPVSYFEKSILKEKVQLENKQPSVSVIVIAKNESDNLQKNLEAILQQDYPNFEVIVVNDGSTDESEDFLNNLNQSYPNLYHTFSPDFRDRKISLTIAIKAAKNEVLLFLEAGCKPDTNLWIAKMMENLTEDKDIVIGYSKIESKTPYYTKLENFDNLIFSLQYFSRALMGKPYSGTYRNIAFRKDLFFNNKGFSKVLNYESCEKVFINHLMNNRNTAVSLKQESFVSIELPSFWMWRGMKVSYLRAKANFKQKVDPFWAELSTRYPFYLVFLGNLIYGSISLQWVILGISILLFLIRHLTQIVVLKKAARHFMTPKYSLSLIYFDLIQPLYNLYFQLNARRKRM